MARAGRRQRAAAADSPSPPSTESGVAWSPDSRRIAFSAKREGQDEPQIYVLDIAGGGEAERVTDSRDRRHAPAVAARRRGDPVRQHDLSRRAGRRRQPARRSTRSKARKYNARAFDNFPIRHWDRWLDERRPTLMLQELDGESAGPRPARRQRTARQQPGFGGDLDNDGEQLEAAWSPDGSTIVFTATAARDQAARADVQQSLYAMPAGGGEPRRLTGDEASYSQPQFAADGSALYARSTPAQRNSSTTTSGWCASTGPTPSPRPVSFGFDRSVGAFQVSPDGETVYLLAEDGGHDRLFSVAGDRRRAARRSAASNPGRLSGLQVEGAEDAPVIVANWGSAVSPPEVSRIDAAGGARRALSAFNAERVAAIDWQPIQEFWFEAAAAGASTT